MKGRKHGGEKNLEQEWEDVIVDGRKQGRIRPKYEITLHPCGLRKKFKTAISIKFNLVQISNQPVRRNETGGLPLLSHVSHSLRGPVDLS